MRKAGMNAEKIARVLHICKNGCTFAALKYDTVPWMSGLVNGLQNRVRRFDSARDLKKLLPPQGLFLLYDGTMRYDTGS